MTDDRVRQASLGEQPSESAVGGTVIESPFCSLVPTGDRPMTVHTKYIYDDSGSEDGTRILIYRLWPRGVEGGDSFE
jgi:hypothetical protein